MCKAKIMVNPAEMEASAVKCRTLTIRERFLRKIMGQKHKVTVIVPGENVHMEIVTDQAVSGGAS